MGALVLVLLCVALAIAMAPATWMARLLAGQLNGALVLTDPDGSFWSGRGHLALGGSRWSAPIRWSLSPWPLLWGRVDLDLDPEGASGPPARLTADGHGIVLTATTLTIPAAALAGTWHQPLPVAIGGEVTLVTPGASLRDDAAVGEITVRWLRARLADNSGQVLDLGNIATTLRARGNGFAGTVTNSGGDATLSGDLVLSSGGSSANVTVTPHDPNPSPLVRGLSMLGSPRRAAAHVSNGRLRQP